MTIGIHDVNYKHYSEYTEYFPQNSPIQVADDREIEGTGADIKLGIIFRPIETSPFRIGLSVTTPTWYDLDTHNYTTMSDAGGSVYNSEDYEFKLYTPWKFGLSLGHTIGTNVALGASYEYADYGSMDTRYITDTYYDSWYDSYSYRTESDEVMNRHTENTLKGVSTLKVGGEFKVTPELALRVGYNYVSPMYKDGGFKDGTIDSAGSYYSSATDFVNWKATNRITCGLGYNTNNWNFDVAYQYATQKGGFMPFMTYYDAADESEDNVCDEVSVNNNRHQLLFTVGYRF
jgi:long-subunit fatty acid transport protein